MKRRLNGFKDELEQEIIEYTATYNLELPTGRFVEKGVVKINREEDSDSLEAYKENCIESNKVRRADPENCEHDQEIQCHYDKTQQLGKDKQRENQKKYAVEKLGIPHSIVPHIFSQGRITIHPRIHSQSQKAELQFDDVKANDGSTIG